MPIMEPSIEQHLNLRQQLVREAASLNDPTLLAEALAFVQQLHARDTASRPGSIAAVMRFFGTVSPAEAEEKQRIIDQEFNNTEGEW